MPIITFDAGKLTTEQKRELAQGMTEVATRVLPKIAKESFVVIIRENEPENISVGGQLLSDRH